MDERITVEVRSRSIVYWNDRPPTYSKVSWGEWQHLAGSFDLSRKGNTIEQAMDLCRKYVENHEACEARLVITVTPTTRKQGHYCSAGNES